EWAGKFLRYETGESSLRGETIEAADRSTWYLSGLSSNARQHGLRSVLPCVLGQALVTWMQTNAAVAPSHVTVVAEGTTAIGAKLLRRLFSAERFSVSGQGRPRFKITATFDEIRNRLVTDPFFTGRRWRS